MIDYKSLLNEAMLSVVKKTLTYIQEFGLTKDQSLYISFHTNHPSVVLSKAVKEKYPQEITIVLQHQFDNLVVSKENFSVNLAFGGMPETIIVPFQALTNFVDPNANFSIQFYEMDDKEEIEDYDDTTMDKADIQNITTLRQKSCSDTNHKKHIKKDTDLKTSKSGDIVMLDKFRKDHTKQ